MNLSAPFIARPVATTLLTVAVVLVGLVALYLLPISPLPRVDIPTIRVSASLPGASPETVAAAITTPLERALGRIAGITEMTSSSTLGSSRIVLQFELSRDINGAARDVQAALNAANSALPAALPSSPSYRKVNPADAPIMILSLSSDTMTQTQIYDSASTIVAQKLSQLKGVGEVEIGGGALPAVRVELNPRTLNQYGIGLEEVRTAVSASNSNRPLGAIDDQHRQWQIASNGQSRKAQDYLPVILNYRSNGAPIQLRDVAQVKDSAQDLLTAGLANGKAAVLVLIRRESDANIIETVDRINQLLPSLHASIPAAINLTVEMERTSTVRASMRDAGATLVIAVGLVIFVMLLFLRDFRAALVPSVAVPVSLIGTFAAMYWLNFSINNLSLMAITIAVGFVVDDAIVVVENISRHIEMGVPPKEAARLGAKEVGFTVLAMTLVLIAVFIPMLFMGGYVGLFVREFAVTLAIAIFISLIIALTTAPMMCALLIKPANLKHQKNQLFQWSERGFAKLSQVYSRSLSFALKHAPLTMLILLLTVALNIFLFVIVSKGFFPSQDTGQLTGKIQGDQSMSFQLMEKKLDEFVKIIQADKAVQSVVGYTGGTQRNSASVFVALKPLSERKESSDTILTRLRSRIDQVPGATLILTPIQDIKVGGRQSRSSYQYTIQADDIELLHVWEPKIRRALAQIPELLDVDTDEQSKGIQTNLHIDRATAARLGISTQQIDSTLNDAFAQRSISTIFEPLNQYRVVMGVAPELAQSADALDYLQLINRQSAPVPLSQLAQYNQTEAALSVNHHSQLAATTISFNLPKGVSLSKATRLIDSALHDLALPNSVRGSFQGSAKAFKEVLDNQPILILAAILTLYIVLGILYESLIHPLTILSTLPSAGVGALLALMLFKMDFNVIAMIGIFMLIGVVMKNAIMMIDFALDVQRNKNASASDAIFQACILRLRPILMTTMAALLAAIPLALGTGDGAEMRQPLGIAIGGGLIVSQLLTLYTTPVVYIYLDRFHHWLRELVQNNFLTRAVETNELQSTAPSTDHLS